MEPRLKTNYRLIVSLSRRTAESCSQVKILISLQHLLVIVNAFKLSVRIYYNSWKLWLLAVAENVAVAAIVWRKIESDAMQIRMDVFLSRLRRVLTVLRHSSGGVVSAVATLRRVGPYILLNASCSQVSLRINLLKWSHCERRRQTGRRRFRFLTLSTIDREV